MHVCFYLTDAVVHTCGKVDRTISIVVCMFASTSDAVAHTISLILFFYLVAQTMSYFNISEQLVMHKLKLNTIIRDT